MSKTILSINHTSEDKIDEMVEGIYDLILETVLSKNEEITIAGEEYY